MRKRNESNTAAVRSKKLLSIIICAALVIALCVTCTLCLALGVGKKTAQTASETEAGDTRPAAALTTSTMYSNGVNGTLAKGDYVDFSSNSIVSIKLYRGTYKLEVWGAKGGNDGYVGGNGGYTYGNYYVATEVTLYVVCGGLGPSSVNSTTAGAYNGGGKAGSSGSSGGGGGATHIATASGVLNDVRSSALVVAGGGGGGGNSFNGDGGYVQSSPAGAAGGGGGTAGSGVAGGNGAGCTGGSVSDIGKCINYPNGNASGSNGGNRVDGNNDGGGGGGGYYGGAASSGDGGGGGGSSYIASGLTTVGGTSGNNDGAGKARITVVNVPPRQASGTNYTITGGVGGTVTVSSANLATDDNNTARYFSNGDANAATFSGGNNARLFSNSAATTTMATTYFTWSWSSNTSVTITCNKAPRETVTFYARVRDNYTENSGSSLQYAWWIVSFTVTVSPPTVSQTSDKTNNKSSNGYVYKWGTPTTTSDATAANANVLYSSSGTSSYALTITERMKIGDSVSIAASSLITGYNGKFKAYIVPSTTKPSNFSYSGITATMYAYNTGSATAAGSYTAYTGYETININALTAANGWLTTTWTLYVVEISSRLGSNYELPSTVYSGTGGRTININLRVANRRPTLVSTNNIYNIGVGETQTIQLSTYFTDADGFGSNHTISSVTLPTYEFLQLDAQIKGVSNVVSTANLYGASGGASFYNVTSSTTNVSDAVTSGTSDVLTGFKTDIVTKTDANSPTAFMYYSFNADARTITVKGIRPSYTQYKADRTDSSVCKAMTGGTTAAPQAFASRGAVQNPGHFYLLVKLTDKLNTSDTGIYLPIAFTVGMGTGAKGSTAPTHTGIAPGNGQTKASNMPKAEGDIGDEFYFVPMAMHVDGTMKAVASRVEDTDGSTVDPADWQPLALDGDSFTTANGLASWNNHINEFVSITSTPAQILTSIDSNGRTVSGRFTDYVKIEEIKVYLTGTWLGGRIVAGSSITYNNTTGINTIPVTADGSDYYTKGIKITLMSPTMDRYLYADVKLNDSTNKEVTAEIAIKVSDTAPEVVTTSGANPPDDVAVFEKEFNDVPAYFRSVYTAPHKVQVTDENGDPVLDGDSNPVMRDVPATVRYTVPRYATFMITPYDLVRDANMTESGLVFPQVGGKDVFTLNGQSGKYNGGVFTINDTADTASGDIAVTARLDTATYGSSYLSDLETTMEKIKLANVTAKKLATGYAFTSAGATTYTANATVKNDRLYFKRSGDSGDAYTYDPTGSSFVITAEGASGYVNYYTGSTVKIKKTNTTSEYPLDFILFDTRTRTPANEDGSAYVSFDMTVRDRYNKTVSVRVEIDVVNTPPYMRTDVAATEIAVVPGATVTETEFKFKPVGDSEAGVVGGVMRDDDDNTAVRFVNPESSYAYGDPNDAGDLLVLRGGFDVTHMTKNVNTISYFWRANETTGEKELNPLLSSIYDAYSHDNIGATHHLLTDYVAAQLFTETNGTVRLKVSAKNSTKNIAEGVFVYFFVQDERGGRAIGCKQVEVVNTPPTFNTSADGFPTADNLWSIAAAEAGDISRVRFITGSSGSREDILGIANVNAIVTAAGESGYFNKLPREADVRVFANADDDPLQSVLLSQSSSAGYVNDVVPTIGQTEPSAVVYSLSGVSDANYDDAIANINAKLIFKVNGVWYTGAALEEAANSAAKADCFDSEGRFIITDWAACIKATTSFRYEAELYNLVITIHTRDNAIYGGDTAGKTTAYNTDRSGARVDVTGTLAETVKMYISDTGLHTKTDYSDSYKGVYVINDHVPVSSIGEEKPGNDNGATPVGYNENADVDTYKTAGAYVYPDKITVAGKTVDTDSYTPTVVPMSYFGFKDNLANVSGATPVYTPTAFVGYDTRADAQGAEESYNRATLSTFADAITISDGTYGGTWTGSTLNNNPYVTVAAVTNSGENAVDFTTSPYYNPLLSMPLDGDGKYIRLDQSKITEHTFGLSFTKKNVRGTADLTLTVKLVMCAGTGSSTATTTQYNTASSSLTPAEKLQQNSKNLRTIEIPIHIDNSYIDLVDNMPVDNDATAKLEYDDVKGTYYTDVVMSTSAGLTFVLVRNGSYDLDSKQYTDDNDDPNAPQYKRIFYTDSDYTASGYSKTDKAKYRDYAYFSSASINGFATGDYLKAIATDDDTNPTKFANVSDTPKAQASMLHYFGISDVAGSVPAGYNPNAGAYGYKGYFTIDAISYGKVMNITPKNKTYINEAALEDIVKNEYSGDTAFDNFWSGGSFEWGEGTYGGLTQAQLTTIYRSRGMEVEYTVDDPSSTSISIKRVYYPLNVIIYDNRSSVWNGASYVAMEFRITIQNATPELKTNIGEPEYQKNAQGEYVLDAGGNRIPTNSGNRTETVKLAVGDSQMFNISDYVQDNDIATIGNSLVTVDQFEAATASTPIKRETGDYLESPYVNNYYTYPRTVGGKTYNTKQDALLAGVAGFSAYDDTEPDVIMYMTLPTDTNTGKTKLPSTSVVPKNNNIWFKVNRRTTANGKAVKFFEFSLTFRDNHYVEGSPETGTKTLTFIIEVTNQAPNVITPVSTITLKATDYFYVHTAYYDSFIGGEQYYKASTNYESDVQLPQEGSPSYLSSLTYKNYSKDGRGQFTVDKWDYNTILSKDYAPERDKFTINNKDGDGGTNLGHLGIANDDTPWTLRFTTPPSSAYVDILRFDSTPAEGAGLPSGSYPLAYKIIATKACVNEPITFTLTDGEPGTVPIKHTIYLTVISTKPYALDYKENSGKINQSHLEGIVDTEAHELAYVQNTFKTYIAPYATTDAGVRFTINGESSPRTAYKKIKVTIGDIAADKDLQGDDEMKLYGDGLFTVKNQVGKNKKEGLSFNNFYISREPDNTAFYINATGYNPNSAYDELQFYVADNGNSSFENAIPITIQVYTIYSDLTNVKVQGMNDTAYSAYLNGSDKFETGSYYEYYVAAATRGKVSTYELLKRNSSTLNAPIVDPDVDVTAEFEKYYTAKVYAFIDENGTALTPSRLGDYLVRTDAGISIREDKVDTDDINKYLIGGVESSGTAASVSEITASGLSSSRLSYVNKYVSFYVASDGTSISFTPQTATLGNDILMYVELGKALNRTGARRVGEHLTAGTLFKLSVKNSAPTAVKGDNATESYNRSVDGYKGDVFEFDIFNTDNPQGSLFADTDTGDTIEIPFDNNDKTYAPYKKALGALADSLDWAPDPTPGVEKELAFTITTTGGKLRIKINRRMDNKVGSSYDDSVTFPITLTGIDNGGKGDPCDVVIMMTVRNTPMTGTDQYVSYKDESGMSYTFERDRRDNDSKNPNEFLLSASIVSDADLEIPLKDLLVDADWADNNDEDSYEFVRGNHMLGGYHYLVDETVSAEYFTSGLMDNSIKLADVTPVFKTYGTGAKAHRSFSAIKIHATSTVRNHTGTVYIRIIDRASDKDADLNGVYICLEVTVLNMDPKPISEEPVIIKTVGSDKTTTSAQYKISDYVYDQNESDVADMTASGVDKTTETYLRIYSVKYLDYAGELFATSAATLPEQYSDDSSLLFSIDYGDLDIYNQIFTVTPNKGFYGTGEAEITVHDGNINIHGDTKDTKFVIRVTVDYNPTEIEALNPISTHRGKTEEIRIDRLIPAIPNIFDKNNSDTPSSGNTTEGEEGEGESEGESGSETEALMMPLRNAAASFNPASAYVLESVTPDKDAEKYVEIKEAGDHVWTLRSMTEFAQPKKINVVYSLKSDPGIKQDGYFMLSVTANLQPVLISKTWTFARYPEEGTDPRTHLNNNNTVLLTADQMFTDPEDDVVKFISAKSNKSSLVSASIVENGEKLSIKFTARGTAEITVTVADETEKRYSYVITVINNDLEEPSLWTRLLASFESNKVVWAVIIGCIILALIILIIVLALLRKRRREREELEALLVSEMEIEDQMLKLAGGPSPTGYQSYGYLQSTPGMSVDPGMMLGAGTETAPTNNAVGLNPGGVNATLNVDINVDLGQGGTATTSTTVSTQTGVAEDEDM